jgi:uncharacterized caspase-like protein
MADKLDFLDEQPTAPEPEGQKPDPAPAEAGKGDEPVALKEPAPDAPAAPPAASDEKPRDIPITALLDEREKRQAAERELQQLRAWRQEQERKAREAAAQAPDFYSDPDQRLQFERQQFQASLWNERLNMSEALARDKFGDETVDRARDAFQAAVAQNPALAVELQSSAHPYAFVVNWYKRQAVLAEIGTDPEAWKARQIESIKEQLRQELMAEMQQTQPVLPKPRLPGSLASAPAAGKAGEMAPRGSAFDAAFGG